MNTKPNKFEVLTGRLQILARPQMWIGSTTARTQPMFVISDTNIVHKDVTYIPSLRKIIDEVIDNSVDALIDSKQKNGKIKVKITSDTVVIEDNGPGIPVVKTKDAGIDLSNLPPTEADEIADLHICELAWTRLFSGTNFQDSVDKMTVGSHGIGSKAANIFSTKFIGRTDDGHKSCRVTCVNNMESTKTVVGDSSGFTGTIVEFKPDLVRFGLTDIEQVYTDLMYQRLICLSITFPDITFVFNGKTINITNKKFVSLFSDSVVFQAFDRGFIGVFKNDADEFNFCTYVNGLSLIRGGSHVDYVINQIVAPIRDKIARKYKEIKPADVRNKLSLIVFMRDFPNTKFDSQTKETLTNSPSDVANYFNKTIDFEVFAKAVLRNSTIIDPIIETFKLKEEVKNRVALKQLGRTRPKIDPEKFISATGPDQEYMFICEGQSACSGISQALGRKGIAYFAARGVPLNVVDAKTAQIIKNKEFSDVMSILNIDPSKTTNSDMSFKTIVHANDADLDGTHIAGIYMGWWLRFAPALFNQHRIARLMTPYVILWADAKMTKIHKSFFTMESFKTYEATHDISKYKKNLYKGLGSWSKEQFQKLFEVSPNGIDDFLQYITLDADGKLHAGNWLKGDSADERKNYLRQYSLDIDRA